MISTLSSRSMPVHLSPEDFDQSTQPLKLIDVRSRVEYNLCHAPDAINLSLPRILTAQIPLLRNLVLPSWFWQLPRDTPIAVVCLTAHRSPLAAQALVKLGFSQVFNIAGGMMAWQKAGLPVYKGHLKA